MSENEEKTSEKIAIEHARDFIECTKSTKALD